MLTDYFSNVGDLLEILILQNLNCNRFFTRALWAQFRSIMFSRCGYVGAPADLVKERPTSGRVQAVFFQQAA